MSVAKCKVPRFALGKGFGVVWWRGQVSEKGIATHITNLIRPDLVGKPLPYNKTRQRSESNGIQLCELLSSRLLSNLRILGVFFHEFDVDRRMGIMVKEAVILNGEKE